jgi:hypothetical protein
LGLTQFREQLLKAWTYSQLDSFESCPKKFYHLKVARDFVDPPTIHTDWGIKVHSAMEEYIKAGTPLPEGMEHWSSIIEKIAKLPGEKLTEHKMALDKAFQPADWGNAWTRGIIDLVIIHGEKAVVLDYKTGKRKPSEQLDLYANYMFAHFPQVKSVVTTYVWLKEKRLDRKKVDRSQSAELWQAMLPRIAKLESAHRRDSWPERPSGLCNGWCPVTSCKFNKTKKAA